MLERPAASSLLRLDHDGQYGWKRVSGLELTKASRVGCKKGEQLRCHSTTRALPRAEMSPAVARLADLAFRSLRRKLCMAVSSGMAPVRFRLLHFTQGCPEDLVPSIRLFQKLLQAVRSSAALYLNPHVETLFFAAPGDTPDVEARRPA